MKKKTVHTLITILTISQLISIIKINKLERKIESIDGGIHNLNNTIRNDMDNIYYNIDNILSEKASLIESATSEIGTFNVDEFTVPITFTLTPKEVSEYTAVSLEFQGEVFPMEKNNTTFSATISFDIFSDAFPKIVIDENGVKKTMEDKEIGIGNIKERLFPTIYPSLWSQVRFDGKVYKIKGTLDFGRENVETEIKYEKMRFLIKVDDKLISDKVIFPVSLSSGYEVDEEIPLGNGQVCTMLVIATDSIGLEHHYIVDNWVAESGSQRRARLEGGLDFGEKYIYSSDGKLLWKPE